MPATVPAAPVIFVLAGVNGAGKSSVGGARLRQEGLAYFNPDEAAQRIRSAIHCSVEKANARAWEEGRRRLESRIGIFISAPEDRNRIRSLSPSRRLGIALIRILHTRCRGSTTWIGHDFLSNQVAHASP